MIELATIDLKYVERNVSRHGTVRWYFRVDGRRVCRLPDDKDSEAFMKAYWAERAKLEEGGAGEDQHHDDMKGPPRPNTFRWLCHAYQQCAIFTELDPTTQYKRKRIIESMLREPVDPKKPDGRIFAGMPLPALDVANITVLRDRKAATPFAADERMKTLRQIFETTQPGRDGKAEKIVPQNTAKLVKSFRKPTDGFHTIIDSELEQYVRHHGVGSKAVFAVVLLMYTGIRLSDLRQIGPQHRRGDKFVLRLFKNRNRTPVTLEIPIHPVLDAVLAMHPVKGMNYMLTEFGKPYTTKGLGNRISEWFDQAGLKHCSAHSVRKGLATNLAESEATDSMLDGFFGWRDGKTSKIYTRKKRQAKLARQAVARIDWGEIGNILPHPAAAVASRDDDDEKKVRKING
ncbi:tyrosine-type recombinase/integrase [Mesorhizobium xinjiangense]|uniref:tyrosine-type recombinase/integrase n=1 Tax=Mesorhizobium xinjiangense TaxID=2678685 RepID=UPI0018DE35FA|nr:tyrosine-type recombinase/integrase [Mesorhizobium xinjiangense]